MNRARLLLVSACLLGASSPLWAAHAHLPDDFNRHLVTTVFSVALVLLLIIAQALSAASHDADNPAAQTPFLRLFSRGIQSGFVMGLALSGDMLSAAALLGLPILMAASAHDGLVFAVGFLAGWPLLTCLLARRIHNLGLFSLGDLLAARFAEKPARIFAAITTLTLACLGLALELIGAGFLIRYLFGVEFWLSALLCAAAMICYARYLGRNSLMWLSVVKTGFLLVGILLLTLFTLWSQQFHPERLIARAESLWAAGGHVFLLAPRPLLENPWSTLSVGLALACGLAGLPTILTRLMTTRDAQKACRASDWGTLLCGLFCLLILIVPLGLIAFFGKAGAIDAEAGLHLLNLARETGGGLFMGALAALVLMALFSATASLVFCGAAAVAGDLYASVIRKGRISRPRERNAGHLASLALGALALGLALLLQKLNLAVGLMLALSVAASSTFPALIATVFWPKATTRGTIGGAAIGLVSALVCIIASPPIWEQALGLAHAPFGLASPALFSMPLAFASIWLISATDHSQRAQTDRADFPDLKIRMETGLSS
ncbi:MAG: hypothetical protein LBL69_05800 [Zoogloeaceae bacterium]|jgi:cation/acetate symporter|nr:hypothetical protein [Zoogloeaceae bacterium]